MVIIGLAGQKQSGKTTASAFIKENADFPCVFEHAFADSLKDFCINTLGLTRSQCGYDGATDEDKNSETPFLWEHVDLFFRQKYSHDQSFRTGFMSSREVMQVQGEMQRIFFCPTLWVDCVFRKIANSSDDCLHIISDIRHKNEVEKVMANNGIVIYLTKRTNHDKADSETELLRIPWDSYPKDHVYQIDNSFMSIEEKNECILSILRIIPNMKLRDYV